MLMPGDGRDAVLCPRFVGATFVAVYSALCGIWLERQLRHVTLEKAEEVALRDHVIPNYYHVNNDRDMLYLDKGRGAMNQFGRDFISSGGNWSLLCLMDSDGDGWRNGQEL